MFEWLQSVCMKDGWCAGLAADGWLARFVQVIESQLFWFVLCMLLFTVLARVFPAVRGQRIRRDEWATDLAYWFVMPLVYMPLSLIVTTLAMYVAGGGDAAWVRVVMGQGRAPFNGWPLWLQCVVVLLLMDVAQYLIHRWFHGRTLWRWHAIHHMPTQLDWLSSARFHPVNVLASTLITGAVIAVIGFDPQAFAYLAVFNVLYSGMVHANLNWTFGPLRYVLASPVFHRWHHTSPQWGGNKNFAPTFAFLDVLGGTFYMPDGDRPDAHGFGVSDPIPKNRFIAQLAWPFQIRR